MTIPSKFQVLVPVDRSVANYKNKKGRLFHGLVARFLAGQSHDIVNEFRDGGTEIDLLCHNKLTDDLVVVECKARSETVKTDAINKLHADVDIYDAHKGWIFSIGELGSEARTRIEKLNAKSQKRPYKHFPSQELVQALLSAGHYKHPSNLPPDIASELFLCVFEDKVVWVATTRDKPSGRPAGHLAWDAITGTPLSPEDAPDVASTDYPFPELRWLGHDEGSESDPPSLQPVVEVIPGEEWSDYRPARPDDFVGRQAVIQDVSLFLERVRDGNTNSRLFGIKGKSGWGKSSLALKLSHDLKRENIHLVPVDCRAAVSSFYPDLAIGRALQNVAEFLSPGPLFGFDTRFEANPFNETGVCDLLQRATETGILVGIIFDQFEAIIHRKELAPAFERMRELALAADEARSSFVIGFSWKTDGTVGSDYPGYHVWHSLSDRRRDFSVDRFTREDADQFISLAQRESKISLKHPVKKFIIENYAGFPWLIKKLVKHYIDLHKSSAEFTGLVSLSLLESLFHKDLEELSAAETRAMKFIAQSSPIEYGATAEKFGDAVVSGLIDKRLVTSTGGQLNLYWDIFRDYILYEEVPQLPNTYVPALSVRKIRSALQFLLTKPNCSYQELGDHLKITLPTTDNVVRDLNNFGVVQPNRSGQKLRALCNNSEDMTSRVLEFLQSHAVFIAARDTIEAEGSATIDVITELATKEYQFISIDERTLKSYVRKILTYCLHFGLLEKAGNRFFGSEPIRNILAEAPRTGRVGEVDLFRAPAPPERVAHLLRQVHEGSVSSLDDATESGLRNSLFAARTLGLIENSDERLALTLRTKLAPNFDELIRTTVSGVEPFKTALSGFDLAASSSDELGSHIADIFDLNWSPGSCRRYGTAYKRWIRWLQN